MIIDLGIMKTFLFTGAFLLGIISLHGQKLCGTHSYQQSSLLREHLLGSKQAQIESLTRQYLENRQEANANVIEGTVIRIPVVVHILYHDPNQMLSNEKVLEQLAILNNCFRRRNADTASTPAVFASRAADTEIEFHLAISDPQRKNTSGIIRKYTPITEWEANDEMKFSANMGNDAWDATQYLNIWVCNMKRVAGYSSSPGTDPLRDGMVLSFDAFGIGRTEGLDQGKTAVHEAGHWLNLRHLWGDTYCGDDGVNDTPVQGGYNTGCPTAPRISCANGPYGDMYMNYMDFTSDNCTNLFTLDQKERMRSMFMTGGPRYNILFSTGLQPPLFFEAPLPEEPPRWLHSQLYPNPAASEITLDLSYDSRWIGKTLNIINLQGQSMKQVIIQAKVQTISIANLQPGIYLLTAKKEDGQFLRHKFVKY